MLACLFIAILATVVWINLTVAETVSKSVYSSDENAEKRAKIKNYLCIIMAIFWAIVIRY